MNASISFSELQSVLGGSAPPLIIDVRRRPAFSAATDMIAGALRRDPEAASQWARALPAGSTAVVYCVHGHEVSQGVASVLGELDPKPRGGTTRWVTRERPKIDRIACPWLVARFVDTDAEFLYVPADQVRDVARQREAVPYDIPNVAFGHQGELCSFDAFLKHYRLADPALQRLAVIVRGADTSRVDLAPQAPGLLAISQGLSKIFGDDHEMLKHGMVLYDALYAWCKER